MNVPVYSYSAGLWCCNFAKDYIHSSFKQTVVILEGPSFGLCILYLHCHLILHCKNSPGKMCPSSVSVFETQNSIKILFFNCLFCLKIKTKNKLFGLVTDSDVVTKSASKYLKDINGAVFCLLVQRRMAGSVGKAEVWC